MAILTPMRAIPSLLCGVLLAVFATAVLAEPLEYAVKAAYLTKFGIYVEWPDLEPDVPLNLCVAGPDPFGKVLDSAASSQQPGSRTVVVHRIAAITPESNCQIAFFANNDPHAPQAINTLRGSPVLTVSDSGGKGAIVNFVIRDNRVRFEIDAAAAAQNNLTLSSKLLGLAVTVKPRTQP
jgi:hypothetical protein